MSRSQPSHSPPEGSRPLGAIAPLALWAALALIALAVLAYCVLLAATSVNVPYLDDYDVILRFLLEAGEPDAEWLKLLFAQHVEHRLVFVRLTALTLMGITGQVDFVALAWIGSLGLALLATGLFVAFRLQAPLRAKCLLFSPVALLLFQPQSWDSFFWATSSLSNLWVLPLGLATLLALAREGPAALVSATALAGITLVAQGNGLLILPAGLVLLGLQRRAGAALFWGASSALLAGLYGLDFQPVEGAPTWLDSLQRAPTLLHYALNFLGSAPGFSHPVASPIFGALLLGSTAALWWKGFPKQNPVLYSLLLLLTASAALNAFGRWHISGAEYPLASVRYRSYSCCMLALSYLCWAEWIATRLDLTSSTRPTNPTGSTGSAEPSRQFTRFARLARISLCLSLAGALVFSTVSYARYAQKAVATSSQLRGGLQHWWTSGRGLRHHDQRHAGSILTRAIERGLYVPIAKGSPGQGELR